MWELVRAGGPFMWPIILCSTIAVGIVLERLWTLQARRVLPPDLTRRVWQLVEYKPYDINCNDLTTTTTIIMIIIKIKIIIIIKIITINK
jgi:biopolymer transport protein ExbB